MVEAAEATEEVVELEVVEEVVEEVVVEARMLVRGSCTPLILALRRRGPSNPNPFQP